MQLSLIVAYSKNRVIGSGNALPWKIAGDLAHFKRTTLGCPIIMGRKTWESLGRPLPGRRNIVITRNKAFVANGAEIANDLTSALTLVANTQEAFIIGGAQIYDQALKFADRIVATEIQAEFSGDAFFKPLDPLDWIETSRKPQAPENGLAYDIVEYRKND
jgi:dihydrofolate reductase